MNKELLKFVLLAAFDALRWYGLGCLIGQILLLFLK